MNATDQIKAIADEHRTNQSLQSLLLLPRPMLQSEMAMAMNTDTPRTDDDVKFLNLLAGGLRRKEHPDYLKCAFGCENVAKKLTELERELAAAKEVVNHLNQAQDENITLKARVQELERELHLARVELGMSIKERDQLRADLEATGRVVLARDSTIDQLRAELALAEKCVEALRRWGCVDGDCVCEQCRTTREAIAAYDKFKETHK